jgi:N6-adenosine-specific RNA methylase IME4/ParB-like chromosome segregation protein Spo0J
MQLQINPDFQNLIRPLTPEEFNLLENSLKNDGCREPITILEDQTIIDGHNRYEICRKHNIEYTTFVQKGLDTETEVKLWMLYNQIGKRNYANIDKALVAIEIEKLEKVKALERMHHISVDEEPRSVLTYPQESGKALEIAAKSVGLGYGTVYKTKHILEKAPEELVEKVRKGDISIDRAFTQIQKAERLENNRATEWPKGKYRVIYADPPWQYGDERSCFGGATDHYNTMTMEELKSMPVASLTEDNAVLFLWGTAPLLPEAIELIEAWGFKYKTNIVWDKVRANLGNYTSVRHEHLFIATKGSGVPDNTTRVDSVQVVERIGRHSEKPEEFRNIIETLYTYGNKLELFARKSVDGWEVFGNECST